MFIEGHAVSVRVRPVMCLGPPAVRKKRHGVRVLAPVRPDPTGSVSASSPPAHRRHQRPHVQHERSGSLRTQHRLWFCQGNPPEHGMRRMARWPTRREARTLGHGGGPEAHSPPSQSSKTVLSIVKIGPLSRKSAISGRRDLPSLPCPDEYLPNTEGRRIR